MTTRASLARGGFVKEQFDGRVHKWERRWVATKKGTLKQELQLELLKWVPTEDRCTDPPGSRHPHIKPVKAKLKARLEPPKPPLPTAPTALDGADTGGGGSQAPALPDGLAPAAVAAAPTAGDAVPPTDGSGGGEAGSTAPAAMDQS